MKIRISVFAVSVFLIFSVSCAEYNTVSIDSKIASVESHLMPGLVKKNQPLPEYSIEERMNKYNIPGVSVAVINDYKIEWAKGYGVKEAGSSDPVKTETLFQAASISKPVAALGALFLVQQGKLDLDEDVNNKLKSWKIPENDFTNQEKVTLRRLITHSAGMTVHGFPGYSQSEQVPTTVQVLDGKGNTDPIRVDTEPGTLWRYSGGGYTIMQQLVEDSSGEPFADFLKTNVLDKIGMNGSGFFQPITREYSDRAATAHRGSGKPIDGKWHTYPEMAAAGFWTTPSDLCTYAIEMQLSYKGESNRLLTQEMTEEMFTHHLGDWGLGPSLGKKEEDFTFGHGGSNEGFRCQLIAFVGEGKGAAVMTNSDNGSTLAAEILRSISAVYGWSIYRPKEVEIASVNPDIYKRYTGEFRIVEAPQVNFKFYIENNALFVNAMDSVSELFPESETIFVAMENGEQFEFNADESGEYNEGIARFSGIEYHLERVK